MIQGVRSLRFFPDYSADPVWDADTGLMVDLDRLPVSEATRDDLRSWRRRWERLAWKSMEANDIQNGMSHGRADPVPPEDWKAVEREGRELFAKLKKDLGPDWTITWEAF